MASIPLPIALKLHFAHLQQMPAMPLPMPLAADRAARSLRRPKKDLILSRSRREHHRSIENLLWSDTETRLRSDMLSQYFPVSG